MLAEPVGDEHGQSPATPPRHPALVTLAATSAAPSTSSIRVVHDRGGILEALHISTRIVGAFILARI